MKRLVLLFAVPLLFTHCKKTPPPPSTPPPSGSGAISNKPVVNTNTATSNFRKVLLEDFTGHTCGNCPRAAEKAEQLLTTYGSSLIVIANHVGGFAVTKASYLEDFRDSTATAWDGFLGMSGAGLPHGAINRVKAPDFPQVYSTWTTLIQTELQKTQTVKLDVTTTYDVIKKLLDVKVLTTFKEAFSSDVGLIITLTQDSIIGSQTDYAPPPGSVVIGGDRRPDYRFDHIMVKSLNSGWGQIIKHAPIAKNDTALVLKNKNTINKCFLDSLCTNDKYMSVVVFVYNMDTKEVLQAEKVKIR
jgi:thiol-disulfide isomerase/thioredoxin